MFGDIDGDGDLDIAIANDFGPNRVFVNDGTGTFTDSGQALGSDSSVDLALGDLNADGDLDIFTGTYFGVGNLVWLNVASPEITNFDGDAVAYTEGAAAAVLDQGAAAGITDADTAVFTGGTLTVSITAGGDTAQDVLSVRDQGAETGQIGLSGSTVSYENIAIGTLAGGTGGADLVIALNGNATREATAALLANLTYENTDTSAPTTGPRTLQVVLADGDGGVSDPAEITVTVSDVNNSPAFAGLDASPGYTEGDPPAVLDANATVSDPELDALNGGAGNYAGGQLTVSVAGGTAADELSFANMTNVSVSGSTLQAGGNTIASFTHLNGTLTIAFTDANGTVPTTALVNEILQAVSFSSTAQDLAVGATATVTINYEISDGVAAGTGSVSLTHTGIDSDDVITGTSGHDILNGGIGDDTLFGLAGNDTLDGGAGADAMDGGTGDDVYYVDDAGDTVVEAFAGGADEVRTGLAAYTLGAHVEHLTGTSALGQVLTGNTGDNTITGGAGNDTLDGGVGHDRMSGGTGDDTYIVDNPGNSVTELADEGTDEVRTGVLAYTLAANVEILTGTSALGQALTGNGLDNTLTGGAGDDTLDGGWGADAMTGGAGDDVYLVDHVGDTVTELVGEGTDEVRTGLAAYTLGANIENLAGTAIAGQILTGNALDNTITGNFWDDTLDGGAGADVMVGLFGNDTYIVDDAGDTVIEDPGWGTDEVRTGLAAYLLGANVENLTGTSAAGQILYGNDLNNVITGGDGDDRLGGGLGDDVLVGGAGIDTVVFGGATAVRVSLAVAGPQNTGHGLDTLTGIETVISGAGADVLIGDAGANRLMGRGGNDRLFGGGGNDRLFGEGGNDSLYGSAGNDVLNGDNGRDVLRGDGGRDVMTGGNHGDTFVFRATNESGRTAASADLITDFGPGDRIDLRAIDASTVLAGNNAFTFDGEGAIGTSRAGDITYRTFDRAGTAGDFTLIYIDTDADRTPEMMIRLTGLHDMVASDFLL